MSKKLILFGTMGMVLLVLTVLICTGIGSVALPIRDIAGILIHKIPWVGDWITPDWNKAAEQIIWKVRFPRVLLAVLVGASLAIAGAGFQGFFGTRWQTRSPWAYHPVLRWVQPF